MEKDVQLSKWELVKYNLLVLPRSWWHFRLFLLMWAAVVIVSWLSGRADPSFELGVCTLINLAVMALAAFLFWYFVMLWLGVSGDHGDDMTGVTKYSIEDEGFRYVTDSTDSLTRWGKVKEVKIIGGMIRVVLASLEFRLLPGHQFDSDAEFRRFYEEIAARVKAAQRTS